MPVVAKRSDRTKQLYAWALGAFRKAAGVKDVYTEKDVMRAVEKLERKYKPKSVSFVFKTCRSLIEGWPRDLTYRFSPSDVEQIAATPEALQRMVQTARAESFDPLYRAYLFLSSIYGLRCAELASIQPTDINFAKGTIFVRTAKGGTQREQALPDVAGHYIAGLTIVPSATKTLNSVYRLVEAMAGIEHRKGAGWHSIRRALATGLRDAGADPVKAKQFMRWKDSGMYEHYALHNVTLDRAIFEIHPFLSFWEEA
jgi:integrase